MTSSYAASKKSALFGDSSPLAGIQTERGLDNSFRNFYSSNSTEDFRLRLFSGYHMFNNALAGFNRSQLDGVARELISPFISFSYDEALNKGTHKETDYEIDVSLNMVREILKRIFPNVGAISVALDKTTIDTLSGYQGPHFAFDFHPSESSDLLDPLSFTSTNGTISFAGAKDVSVVLFIPKSYLQNTIINAFSEAARDQRIPPKQVIPSTAFQKARQMLASDIFVSIIQNIYADRQREFIFSQMRTLFFVAGSVANVLPTAEATAGNRNPANTLAAYRDKIMQDVATPILMTKFKTNNLPFKASPDLGNFLLKTYSQDYTNVNPIMLYRWLCPITTEEVNAMVDKITSLDFGGNMAKYSTDNLTTRDYLMHTFGDTTADMLALGILIGRMLPVILLSVFIYGAGMKVGYFERFETTLNDVARTLKNFVGTSMNSRILSKFVQSIQDIVLVADGDLSTARIGEIIYALVAIVSNFK